VGISVPYIHDEHLTLHAWSILQRTCVTRVVKFDRGRTCSTSQYVWSCNTQSDIPQQPQDPAYSADLAGVRHYKGSSISIVTFLCVWVYCICICVYAYVVYIYTCALYINLCVCVCNIYVYICMYVCMYV
jgi:hypothetical protein